MCCKWLHSLKSQFSFCGEKKNCFLKPPQPSGGVIIKKKRKQTVGKMHKIFALHFHAIWDIAFRCSDIWGSVRSDDYTATKQTPPASAASFDTYNEQTPPHMHLEKEYNPPNKDVFTMAVRDNMLFSLLPIPLIHSPLYF